MQSYKPMLAKTFPKPFSHRDWLFEVKWDGFRAIAYIKNDYFSLRSRNDNELRRNFPEISELRQLTKDVVLDGELVVMKHGAPDFQAMQERAKATNKRIIEKLAVESPATYVVFDILEKDGEDLTNLPLYKRKEILKGSVKEGKQVCLVDSVDKTGEEYYKVVAANGLEGVVAKKKDSTYEQGKRSDSWLKIKQLQSCDCVIFGYTDGEGSRSSTFGSLVLGLYNEDSKPVYVCNVSSGLNQAMLETLLDFFRKTTVEKKGKVTWVKPLLVCEVGYQTVTRDMSLRAPRLKNLRLDKKPSECTLEQLYCTPGTPKNDELEIAVAFIAMKGLNGIAPFIRIRDIIENRECLRATMAEYTEGLLNRYFTVSTPKGVIDDSPGQDEYLPSKI